MPIQRIALGTLCLAATVVISLAVTLVSADEDPFSNWVSNLPENDVAESPSWNEKDGKPATPLPEVIRETEPESETFSESGTSSSGIRFFSPRHQSTNGPTRTRMKPLTQVQSDSVPTIATPKANAVVHAAAVELGKANTNTVVRVSGSDGDEFREYVYNAAPATSTVTTADFDEVPVLDMDESGDDDNVESDLFFDKSSSFDAAADPNAQTDEPTSDFNENELDKLIRNEESTVAGKPAPADEANMDTDSEPAVNTVSAVDTVSETDTATEHESSNPFTFAEPALTDDAVDVGRSSVIPNVDGSELPAEHTGAQSPKVELKWTRHGDMNVGQECNCSLDVINTGNSLVRNVTVEAAVPEGLHVVRATPIPRPGTASWTVGDMKPGESKTVDSAEAM